MKKFLKAAGILSLLTSVATGLPEVDRDHA